MVSSSRQWSFRVVSGLKRPVYVQRKVHLTYGSCCVLVIITPLVEVLLEKYYLLVKPDQNPGNANEISRSMRLLKNVQNILENSEILIPCVGIKGHTH